jgi:hypothetical protein
VRQSLQIAGFGEGEKTKKGQKGVDHDKKWELIGAQKIHFCFNSLRIVLRLWTKPIGCFCRQSDSVFV